MPRSMKCARKSTFEQSGFAKSDSRLSRRFYAEPAMRMIQSSFKISRHPIRGVLALSFLLVFLLSQSFLLLHTHAGDLNKHIDCAFCLNLGSGDDAPTLTVSRPEILPTQQQYLELATPPAHSWPISAKSRSPPQTSLI